MTLDDSRVDETFWLFGLVMPIPQDDSKKKALEAIIGGKLETIVPQFMKMLSLMIKDNHDAAEMWISFVSESLDYIQGKSNKLPDVDYPQEEINRLMRIQRK